MWNGQDTANCEEQVTYVPLTGLDDEERNEFRLWTLHLESYGYNGEHFGEGENWLVAIDSGAAVIAGPDYEFLEFIETVNQAQFNRSHGAYTSRCNTTFVPVNFVLGGETYTVPTNQFVHPIQGSEYCALSLTILEDNKGHPQWILGHPFLRTRCAIFDVSNKSIGFADHKNLP